MISDRQIRQVESNIKRKIAQISNKEITIEDSKIGIQFNALKSYDQASYERLIQKYKSMLLKL